MKELPQVVKDICAISPYVYRTIFAEAFIIESIYLVEHKCLVKQKTKIHQNNF